MCKVPAHIEIKGNEEVDKAAKLAIDIPEMATTRLLYTNYYLIIRRARNSEWEWKSAHNSFRQYEVKVSRLCIGHTGLTQEMVINYMHK